VTTPKVEDCIRQDLGAAALSQLIVDGRYHGMQAFDQALFGLCREGLVSLRDALAAAADPEDLRLSLQQAGLATV
jgi:twitching motility protein PilT